jgi:hypothetical protein
VRLLFALAFWLIFGAVSPVVGGEIVFVDPGREKAQSLSKEEGSAARHEQLRNRLLDDARVRSGRQVASPLVETEASAHASERTREARDYLNETSSPQTTTILLKSDLPSSDAARTRQAARAWYVPAPNTAANHCRTENTVGSIEGTSQGHAVIQSTVGGVNVCK